MASQIKPEFGNLFNELCEEQVAIWSDDNVADHYYEDVFGENFVMEIMILAVCRDDGLGVIDMYVQDVLQSNSMNYKIVSNGF